MDHSMAAAIAVRSNAEAVEIEMAVRGVTRHPVEGFRFRQFRYANLEDAIAQAIWAGALGPGTGHPPTADEIAQCGIVRDPGECFHYRNFRYANLNDALAQASWVKAEA